MNQTPNTPAMPAVVANWQCGHCDATPDRWQDQNGLWHSVFNHDPSCPVLAGSVNPAHDLIRAVSPAYGRNRDEQETAQ